MGSLDGKVAVVTDAGSGLGRAFEEFVPHLVWIAQHSPESFLGNVVYLDDWGKSWGAS